MKRIFTVVFMLIFLSSKGQYVSIPDDNLRAALKYNFPQCFNGDLMDTLIAGSLTERGVGVEGLNIQSLEGMQYFKTFISFFCADNLLTDLKFLPPNIVYLNAPGNLISSIDSLPKKLEYLDLSYNSLSSLLALPASLETLYLTGNPALNCLPVLPAGLQNLSLYQTGVHCLPNKPEGLATTYPLCNPTNNIYNCQALPIITGRVFVDLNNNGIREAGEPYRKAIKVMITSLDLYTFSDDSGYYALSVPAVSAYEVAVSNPYYSSVPEIITSKAAGQATQSHDIALTIVQQGADYSVTVTNYNFARPGFELAFRIELDNIGSEGGPAEVTFTLPPLYTFDSSSVTAALQSGVLTWQVNNLLPGERKSIILYGRLSASSTLGDTLTIVTQINADDLEDLNTANNTNTLKIIIRGAYDPNDKQGPKAITPAEVSTGEYLYYTVRFQNTGTDTAFTVVIADELDMKVQANTLELLSSSHNCNTVMEGRQWYFEFENIQLPDSNTNKAASCGYVSFRVRPVTTLVEDDVIPNGAAIYFDYNSPVISNTVQTLVKRQDLVTGSLQQLRTIPLQAFPNPVQNGVIYLTSGAQYKIFNNQGAVMKEGISDGTAIPLRHLPAGLYIVEMTSGEIHTTERIIVMD